MLRTVCKSKLHGARVTEANVHYTGSITLDAELMRSADLVPYEQVHVVDVDNGERIVTYCIEGPAGSGTVCVNGAAARLIAAGDTVIVISYAQVTPAELEALAPKIVMLDERNAVRQILIPPPVCPAERRGSQEHNLHGSAGGLAETDGGKDQSLGASFNRSS